MKHLFLSALLLAAGAAHAQATFNVGPVVGGNLATIQRSVNVEDEVGYHFDWLAGAQAAVSWHKVALQPALLFSQKGFRTTDTFDYRDANNLPVAGTVTYHSNVQLGYLTLPVNVVYAPLGTKAGPQVFAGPYASVLLAARDRHTDLANAPAFGTATNQLAIAEQLDAGTYGYRRFDAGLQGGIGYHYAAFQLQASYSLGLRTTTPQYSYLGSPVTTASVHNRCFQLSLAYLFSTGRVVE